MQIVLKRFSLINKFIYAYCFIFSLSFSELNVSLAIPRGSEHIEESREKEEQLKRLEDYTVIVESAISSQGLMVLVVPTVSLVTKDGEKGVLVIGENYEPLFQNVELGLSEGSKTEIISGIELGDRIFIAIPPWLDHRW